ncbi:MAG: 50S ribosomal protein L32e [Candidatus Aenigmarchaeota archaeon]|nr:50S ribosomal protein L32e [Candidatus Aenigmarchaeota archaeon]
MVNKKKKPAFKRWMSDSYARLGESWRHPRGRHSKVRRREKGKVKMPFIGWGAKASERGLHPSGFREVIVHTPSDLKAMDAKSDAAKISSTTGARKRAEIVKIASEMKIKVLNPGVKSKTRKA